MSLPLLYPYATLTPRNALGIAATLVGHSKLAIRTQCEYLRNTTTYMMSSPPPAIRRVQGTEVPCQGI